MNKIRRGILEFEINQRGDVFIYELDSTRMIDQDKIKSVFFASHPAIFNIDSFDDIELKNPLNSDEQKIIEIFLGRILTKIICESASLWTSLFIQNEIRLNLTIEEQMEYVSKKQVPLFLANPFLRFVSDHSFDTLLITLYHFWFKSEQDDCCWHKIFNILFNHLEEKDWKRINTFISTNIFKNKKYNTSDQYSDFSKLKDYRNNLYAHITTNDVLMKGVEKDGDGNCVQVTYPSPRKPDANILFELSAYIKIIGSMLYKFVHNDMGMISFMPNLFFISGGAMNQKNITITWKNELKYYYFIEKDWKTVGYFI